MKYPFTPEILDAIPEKLAELYRELEDTLLYEICSRLNISGELNEVTVQSIRALRSHGIDIKDIKKAITKTTNVSRKELDKLFDDVVKRNQNYFDEVVTLADITEPATYVDKSDIDAIRKQTHDEISNITQSMGFYVQQGGRKVLLEVGEAYQWALDNAVMQIQSGAISYNQAISSAVKQLADSGLKTISYESGHVDSVDVAVRRAVLTGVNQLNAKYNEQAMDRFKTDLVEVDAHIGARNTGVGAANHESWQGKVYRWKEYTDKYPNSSTGEYPDFIETTGYGTGEGLCGWNCRHGFVAFVEGVMEPTYTDDELEKLKAKPFEFEGKQYDTYTATQKQRQIERTIRKLKREKAAYKAAGLTEDAQTVNIRIRRLTEEYRSFSKTAKLPEQRERLNVSYIDTDSEKAAAELKIQRDAESPIREAIKRGQYPLEINPEKQARHMHGTALPGRSVITISQDELQEIINTEAGNGKILFKKNTFDWQSKEIVAAGRIIGYTINEEGKIEAANSIKIHYSKTGVHAVPHSRRWKK